MNKQVATPELHSVSLTDARDRKRLGRFLDTTPSAYIMIVLVVMLGACAYGLWAYGIFRCQASGYGSDRYLGYCGATSYGDYDHGAFWFDLEPRAVDAARSARVLFLGNSRMQFGFSTKVMADWFASLPAPHYLLGFSHNANYTFEAPLLRKLHPKAEAYVVNIDLFFEQFETPPARAVMRESVANIRYEQKQGWQRIHKPFCASFPAICGNAVAYFRSPTIGAWVVTGHGFTSAPVSYDRGIDQSIVEAYSTLGSEFLSRLPVRRECAILTMVPTVNTSIGTAKAIASAIGQSLIAPELDGLSTFDESHLDPESAERWSNAFIEAAGPQIQKCLAASPGRVAQASVR